MKRVRIRNLVWLLVALSAPLHAEAAIYRWVDANGELHFSQSPPPGVHYQRIDPQVPPPTSAPAVRQLGPAAKRFDAQRAAEQRAREAALATKARQAEACAKARSRVSFLQEKTAHRLFVRTKDGQLARMTEPQFQQQLDAARAAEQANCR